MPRNTSPKTPMALLRQSVQEARDGIEPPFTSESLLQTLGLDSELPDKKTLLDRFIGNAGVFGTFGALRDFAIMDRGGHITQLIVAANEHTANPAQEAIAHALGAVVCRQFEREQLDCPFVGYLVGITTRDDIIPSDIRQAITGPAT